MTWAQRAGDAAKGFVVLALSVTAIGTDLFEQIATKLNELVHDLIGKT